MPKFAVDVKAFINIEVEAENKAAAQRLAETFVDSLSPTDAFVDGYNRGLREAGKRGLITNPGAFDVDGESDVERVCSVCGDQTWDINEDTCSGCEPEPEEPPLDTPSLDTSFHDHEMDV